MSDTTAAERRQRLANRATFLAMGSALVFVVVALVGDWEGMAGLALGLLLYFIALLHLPLGIVALFSAFGTGRVLRNFWIYGYFFSCALAAVMFLGTMNEWDQALESVVERVFDPATVQLRDAVAGRRFDVSAARAAIEAGAKVNTVDRQGRTPLMQAANAGELELVRALLAAGADVGAPAGGADTAMHFAAAGGGHRYSSPQDTRVDPELIRMLLDAGADPAARGYDEQTPLLSACIAGSVEGYDVLRAAGADAAAQDRSGHTCIELAVEAGRAELVRHLMRSGIDPHVAGEALVIAVYRGKPELFRLLLEEGADPSPLMGDRESLVLRFVDTAQGQREKIHAQMYDALLASGRGQRAFARGGYEELQWALGRGPDVLASLLALGLEADVRSADGATLLHAVADRSSGAEAAEQARMLLAAGVPPDAVDDRGRTALMQAAARGNLEVVEVLVHAGADMHLRDERDFDALVVAARAGYGFIIDAMADAGLGNPPPDRHGDLLVAAREHGTSMAALLRLGLNPDTPDSRGVLPLFDSISFGAPEAVAALLEAGADKSLRQDGYTPLTAAASRDRDEAIAVLIAAGADPDERDARRRSALELAIKGRRVLSCIALIEGGVTLTADARQQIRDKVINPESRIRGRDRMEALLALL